MMRDLRQFQQSNSTTNLLVFILDNPAQNVNQSSKHVCYFMKNQKHKVKHQQEIKETGKPPPPACRSSASQQPQNK